MDEKYRLVFRGEILEGQHRAVVKRRLRELLKLDEARLEKLFSGSPVVVKRGADRKTAERYQALFKQAGSRLRVLVDAADDAAPGKSRADASREAAPAFTVQSNFVPPPPEPRTEIEAPAFSLADVGAILLEAVASEPVVVPEADFELAEVGADLLTERPPVQTVELGPLDFDIAEVGAKLAPEDSGPAVSAPDVSHLSLVEP